MAKSVLHNDKSGGCILNSLQRVNMAIIIVVSLLTNMNFVVHYLKAFSVVKTMKIALF